MTAHRRVPAVARLEPVSGDALGLYTVRHMVCINIGVAEDVRWRCTTADMPQEFTLGTTTVKCEGYESTDDPFILRGSCAARYDIYLSAVGRARFSEHKYEKLFAFDCIQVKLIAILELILLYLPERLRETTQFICLFFGIAFLRHVLKAITRFQAIRRQRAKRIVKMDLDTYSTLEAQWLDCVDQPPLHDSTKGLSYHNQAPPPPYTATNEEAQVMFVSPYDTARDARLPAAEHEQEYKHFRDPSTSSSGQAPYGPDRLPRLKRLGGDMHYASSSFQ
ncbi:uncharacterized protein V1518DRAFT_407831 [Limtongia smithiae]|uniref:uncharacterized protein n=1 Tax=Limtongia smithiae TaxID=1125753 RepID=UPI0034CE7861